MLGLQGVLLATQTHDTTGRGYLNEAAAAPRGDPRATGLTPLNPDLTGVLLNGQRPLFVWHPLTAVAVLGLLAALLKRPRLALCLLLPLAAQVYLIASWQHGYQGAALGTRMLAGATPLFALGLALLYTDLMPGRTGRGGSPAAWHATAARTAVRLTPYVVTALALAFQLSLTVGFMRGEFKNPRQPPTATLRQVLHLDQFTRSPPAPHAPPKPPAHPDAR